MIDEREYRAPNGKLTAPIPGSEIHQITPANARNMAQKRWENYRRAALRRIVGEAASIDPTVSTAADAFALVASKQYVALMDYDKPRIDELQKLGEIMIGGKQEQQQEAGAGAAFVAGAGAMADTMLRVMRDIMTIQDNLHDTITADAQDVP